MQESLLKQRKKTLRQELRVSLKKKNAVWKLEDSVLKSASRRSRTNGSSARSNVKMTLHWRSSRLKSEGSRRKQTTTHRQKMLKPEPKPAWQKVRPKLKSSERKVWQRLKRLNAVHKQWQSIRMLSY